MTEVMARGYSGHSHEPRERTEHAGEIIEERRKDAEGRIGTYKYLKGKMLGKVGILVSDLLSIDILSYDIATSQKNFCISKEIVTLTLSPTLSAVGYQLCALILAVCLRVCLFDFYLPVRC